MSESVIDFAAMETPTLETPVETPTAGEETTTTGEETQTETTTAEESTSGGTPEKPAGAADGKPPTLKALRDAVKAFEQTSPELGKHLKALLDNEGRIRAYQEVYPDVDSARSLKAAVEAAGGLEGVAELSRLRDSVEEVDAMIENGDPEVIERIFSDSKEGPAKLLPHYMNRVEKESPEAFGNAIRPHLVRSLTSAGFPSVVGHILRTIAGGGTAEQKLAGIAESAESMAQWFDGEKRLGEKSNLDSLEPERGKLKEEWGKLTTEKQKIFEGEVNAEVAPAMNKAFAQRMRSYLEHDTRPDAAKRDIAQAWLRELAGALTKDQKHIQGMMKAKTRNKAAIVTYATSRINAVADEVTNKIVKEYKLTPGKAAPKTAGGGGGQEPNAPQTGVGSVSSPIRVKDKPADSNIDWDADPDRMHFISGKAKLLHGSKQWVKWR